MAAPGRKTEGGGIALISAGRGIAAALIDRLPAGQVATIDPTSADLVADLAGHRVAVMAWIDPDLTQSDPFRGDRCAELVAACLAACVQADIEHVVLISSAMVAGADASNPVPLADDAPAIAAVPVGVVPDLVDAERQVQQWGTSTKRAVTILRCAVVAGPGIDTFFTRYFESPRLLVVRGSVPTWQFAHIDDVATAVEVVAREKLTGAVPVACTGWLTQAQVEGISGLRSVELPASVVVGTAERLHRLGVTPAPAEELDYLRYPWAVDATRLRDAGWQAAWTNEQVVTQVVSAARGRLAIAGRRVGPGEVTAVTAAAAVLGAAAIVRARRRRLG